MGKRYCCCSVSAWHNHNMNVKAHYLVVLNGYLLAFCRHALRAAHLDVLALEINCLVACDVQASASLYLQGIVCPSCESLFCRKVNFAFAFTFEIPALYVYSAKLVYHLKPFSLARDDTHFSPGALYPDFFLPVLVCYLYAVLPCLEHRALRTAFSRVLGRPVLPVVDEPKHVPPAPVSRREHRERLCPDFRQGPQSGSAFPAASRNGKPCALAPRYQRVKAYPHPSEALWVAVVRHRSQYRRAAPQQQLLRTLRPLCRSSPRIRLFLE